jgi:hypothetical protein
MVTIRGVVRDACMLGAVDDGRVKARPAMDGAA